MRNRGNGRGYEIDRRVRHRVRYAELIDAPLIRDVLKAIPYGGVLNLLIMLVFHRRVRRFYMHTCTDAPICFWATAAILSNDRRDNS